MQRVKRLFLFSLCLPFSSYFAYSTRPKPRFHADVDPTLCPKSASNCRTRDFETQTIDGTITSVHWGAMGDFPGFEMTSDEGVAFRRRRLGNITRYVVGLRARAVFVVEPPHDDTQRPELAQLYLEDSDRRTEGHGPGPEWLYKRGHRNALEVAPEGERIRDVLTEN